MTYKNQSDKSLEIRSVNYIEDENSNEKWFELWIRLAKKELVDYYSNKNDHKQD